MELHKQEADFQRYDFLLFSIMVRIFLALWQGILWLRLCTWDVCISCTCRPPVVASSSAHLDECRCAGGWWSWSVVPSDSCSPPSPRSAAPSDAGSKVPSAVFLSCCSLVQSDTVTWFLLGWVTGRDQSASPWVRRRVSSPHIPLV